MSRRADEVRGMRKERARIVEDLRIRRACWHSVVGDVWAARYCEADDIIYMINARELPRVPKRKRRAATVVQLRRVGA